MTSWHQNGWLDTYVSQYKIKMASQHGESAVVLLEATEQWKTQLSKLCEGYLPMEIWNWNETSISFWVIPSRSFVWQGEDAAGTSVLKECLTFLLTLSMTGRKEKIWLMGKAKQLHSFPKHTSDLQKHCTYKHSTKAWMTSTTFIEYLNWLNNKMLIQSQKILPFIDNCTSHTPVTFPNVTIMSVLKNTLANDLYSSPQA